MELIGTWNSGNALITTRWFEPIRIIGHSNFRFRKERISNETHTDKQNEGLGCHQHEERLEDYLFFRQRMSVEWRGTEY